MVERFGENSYMATQALGTWEKAERAIRYETREMANQIQNQIFLTAMIAQNIMSDAVPAFMKWGETSAKLKEIFTGLGASFGRFGSSFSAGIKGTQNMKKETDLLTTSILATSAAMSVLPSSLDRLDRSSRSAVGS